MIVKKMRPLKTGGFSLCSCPDDLVGKGRCRHVLGFASIVWDYDNLKMVDMDGNEIGSKKEDLVNYLSASCNEISEDKKQKILEYFNNL